MWYDIVNPEMTQSSDRVVWRGVTNRSTEGHDQKLGAKKLTGIIHRVWDTMHKEEGKGWYVWLLALPIM